MGFIRPSTELTPAEERRRADSGNPPSRGAPASLAWLLRSRCPLAAASLHGARRSFNKQLLSINRAKVLVSAIL